jgi:hypothetical protein
MSKESWSTSERAVANLQLDPKNPRISGNVAGNSPRDLIKHLFEHDKAMEVAQSIATRGYFPNEPLLAVREGDLLVVVEGNRRLAALKALREPSLLDGTAGRAIERLSRQLEDPGEISTVPVTIAPSRRATDRQIAGRHVGTPVLPWQAENRASFILNKLAEGYTDAELSSQLGFSLPDIAAARRTRSIAEMARSVDLPAPLKEKLNNPRSKILTTLERIFDSSVGRKHLMVEPDAAHGIRGVTSKAEFLKGFTRLVRDIASGKESSRTLNKNEDIDDYFKKRIGNDRPEKKNATFVPSDIVGGTDDADPPNRKKTAEARVSQKLDKNVIPKRFRITFGNDRLRDIRNELVKLDRERFPNAGAVLLRVFLELSIISYFERVGELKSIVTRIEEKEGRRLPFGVPTLRQLIPEVIRIAKANLNHHDAARVEKAIRYDAAAPFTVSELHAFVHQADLPSARDILQFWARTEPLFNLLLSTATGSEKA